MTYVTADKQRKNDTFLLEKCVRQYVYDGRGSLV